MAQSAMPDEEADVKEQYKKEGNQFFAAGDYVKAVAAYNKAIKADPENGVLYRCSFPSLFDSILSHADDSCCSNRAAAFIHLQKEVKAIKDADQAIALKPDWAKGYYRKGNALVALRRCVSPSSCVQYVWELKLLMRTGGTRLSRC